MKIPRFIRNNFLIKLISLLIAVVVYWEVSEFVKEERTVKVPVNVCLPQDLMMSPPQQFEVGVKVRGNRRDIDNSPEKKIKCSVEVGVNDPHDGDCYPVKLSKRNFRTTGGIRVVEIQSNSELQLKLKQLSRQERPIDIVLSGEVPKGFRVSGYRCTPSSVIVSGAEEEVNNLTAVFTAPVPVDNRESSFEYEAELRNPGGFEFSIRRVKVEVDVVSNSSRREFSKVPVGVFNDAQPGMIVRFGADTPPVAAVTVTGTEAEVRSFKNGDLRLYVDVSDISTAGVYTLPVECHIRRECGIRVKRIAPAQFKVTVCKMPIKK